MHRMTFSRTAAGALARGALLAALVLPQPSASQPAPAVVRVAASLNEVAATAYYAQELGYFKPCNLDVQTTLLRNGSAIAGAVAGGSVDVGETNVLSAMEAHEKGLPWTLFAPAGEYVSSSASTVMVVAPASPIGSAKDLDGKIVAVSSLKDLTYVATAAWIDKNGGDSSKVRFYELPPLEMGAALARGTIDAATVPVSLNESAATRVLSKPYDALGNRFVINAWFAPNDWLRANPSTAACFARAVTQAGQWVDRHPDESAALLSRYTKVPLDTIRTMNRATFTDRFDPKTLQPLIEAAVKYKALARAFPAAELYTLPR